MARTSPQRLDGGGTLLEADYVEILVMEEKVMERIHDLIASQTPVSRREVELTTSMLCCCICYAGARTLFEHNSG